MRVLGFTSASTAGLLLLLLLLGTAPTTTRTTSSAAPCGDQANDTCVKASACCRRRRRFRNQVLFETKSPRYAGYRRLPYSMYRYDTRTRLLVPKSTGCCVGCLVLIV